MRNDHLRALTMLAEGENKPPAPQGLAKTRAELQKQFDAAQEALPRLHALVNQLAPHLVGGAVETSVVTQHARDLADEAATLGRAAAALADAAEKYGREEREGA